MHRLYSESGQTLVSSSSVSTGARRDPFARQRLVPTRILDRSLNAITHSDALMERSTFTQVQGKTCSRETRHAPFDIGKVPSDLMVLVFRHSGPGETCSEFGVTPVQSLTNKNRHT